MSYELSDKIKMVLIDDDVIWPTTMDGHFRLITQKKGHNILGDGEHYATEAEMIDGVLNYALPSRWRSKKMGSGRQQITSRFRAQPLYWPLRKALLSSQ